MFVGTICAMYLKNMKQRQSGHAVKGPAYGCSHIILWTQMTERGTENSDYGKKKCKKRKDENGRHHEI